MIERVFHYLRNLFINFLVPGIINIVFILQYCYNRYYYLDINNEINEASDTNPKPGTSKHLINGDKKYAYTFANGTDPKPGTSKQVLNGDMDYSYTSESTNPQPGTSRSSTSSDNTNPKPRSSKNSTSSSNDTNPEPSTSRSRHPHPQGISGKAAILVSD